MATPTIHEKSRGKEFNWMARLLRDPAFPIYISGFLDLFGVSMILPFFMSHARELGASRTMAGVLGSFYGAVQLFTSPLVGQWSDVSGRRFTLLVCLIVTAFGYAMFSFASTILFMFMFRLPLGIFKHSQNISKSYLADISKSSEQSAKMGHFNAASSIGFILGPVVGGHVAVLNGGFYLVAILAGVVFLINYVLIWFTMKEETSHSLKRNYSSATSLKQMQSDELNFSSKSFWQAAKEVDWRDLWDIYLVKFLLGASVIVFRSNSSLMLVEKYQTTPVINGYITSVSGIVSALIGFVTGSIAKYYNNNAKLLLHLSILQVFTLLCLSLSPNLVLFVLSLTPLSLVTTVARVAGTSLTLERGNEKEIGILMGFQQSCMSVARMLAPLIAGLIQEISLSGPGLFGSLLALLAVTILVVRPQDPKVRSKMKEKKNK